MSTLEGSLKLIRELLEIETPPQPSPPPPPAGGNFKLGWGLAGLDQLLSQADADSPLNLSVLESRLLDNLSDVRLYSSTETLRSEGALERARIGGKLKRLALDRVGSSLNDVF